MDFWSKLTDTTGFMPRRICGLWSPELIRLHNISDLLIWLAYLAIPLVLVTFAYKRRHELPFHQLFWLFGLFIVACGTTHLMDIVLFYWPAYRLSGIIKLITAAASWGTVLALIPIVPRALAMRSPETLQQEIDERQRAEAQVRQLNAELESRVTERTLELAKANDALEATMRVKDELLASETRARSEAEVANRAKDEFLATLSHELRTPINSIQGWAWLLQTEELDAQTTKQALDAIHRISQSQTRLVEEVLDVSRIITGKMRIEIRLVPLPPIIENALTALAPAALAKNITIESHLDSQLDTVRADPDRLQQILWNLLSNAIKFTPKGGRVEISTRRLDSVIEVAVADNGPGIEAELLPFVFDRFRQGDSSSTRAHGGLGLGLSIVRHLSELHGGTVRVESAGPNLGATFIVSLPA